MSEDEDEDEEEELEETREFGEVEPDLVEEGWISKVRRRAKRGGLQQNLFPRVTIQTRSCR